MRRSQTASLVFSNGPFFPQAQITGFMEILRCAHGSVSGTMAKLMNGCWRNAVALVVSHGLGVVTFAEIPASYGQAQFRVTAELRDGTVAQMSTTAPENELPPRIFNPDPGASPEVEPTPIP